MIGNEETKVDMLTRSRNMLEQSGDKWGESKRERAKVLFGFYPQMREAYFLSAQCAQSLRCKSRGKRRKRNCTIGTRK